MRVINECSLGRLLACGTGKVGLLPPSNKETCNAYFKAADGAQGCCTATLKTARKQSFELRLLDEEPSAFRPITPPDAQHIVSIEIRLRSNRGWTYIATRMAGAASRRFFFGSCSISDMPDKKRVQSFPLSAYQVRIDSRITPVRHSCRLQIYICRKGVGGARSLGTG